MEGRDNVRNVLREFVPGAEAFTSRKIALIGLCLSLILAGGLTSVQHTTVARAQSHLEAEDTATGAVFDDLNRNGERDKREPGVPGVLVSNGRDVVQTDSEGRYSLSVNDETILFITKPSGYMVPVNEVQLPQFYYVHYPNGSPHDTEYPGIEPTGPLPESVDFPIFKQAESNRFDAVVFADPQTRNHGELDDFQQDVVAELVGADADLGLTVGDIVNDTLSLFPRHNAIVSTIGIPWWNLPGNHDMNFDVPDDEYATDTYKSVYGPTNYSADYGRVHFVNMDNVDYMGPGEGYRGFLNETQLEWLKNDLSYVPRDKLIVISTHIPLRTEAIGGANVNTVNLDELFAVLEGRNHLYSISGHDTSNSWQMYMESGELRPSPPGVNDAVWTGEQAFHHQVLAEVRGGGWTTGPLDERGIHAADMADGNPNGYYFVRFDGNEYRPRFKAASLPEDFQMRITFEGGESNQSWIPSGPSGSRGISPPPEFHPSDWRRGQEPQVVVNVFDGGERHQVQVRFDDREFVPMDHDPPRFGLTNGDPDGNLDPYMVALFEQYVGTPEVPAEPQPSSHLWTAPLPSNLGPGAHTVTIRRTDPYGQVAETSESFEIRAR